MKRVDKNSTPHSSMYCVRTFSDFLAMPVHSGRLVIHMSPKGLRPRDNLLPLLSTETERLVPGCSESAEQMAVRMCHPVKRGMPT